MLVAAVQAGVAQGQPLREFLASAEQQNLDAQLGAESRARAEAEWGQAWGALLPSLTASGAWTRNQYEAVIDVPSGPGQTQKITIIPRDQLEASLRVELPLVDAGRWVRTAAAASSARAAAERESLTREQVRRQVVTSFYAHAGARAVLESARKALAVAEAQLAQQEVRNKAGVATELELVRARAEVGRNRQVVADAEALVATSRRTLHSLSGLEPREVPPIAEDDLSAAPALEQLEPRVESLPAVRAATHEAEAASHTSLAADMLLVPTLNAQYTHRFTNATGFQNASDLYNAGLVLNWRVDMVGLQAMRAQHALEATAALNADKARQQARDQLHSDWLRVGTAVEKVRAAGAQREAAQRAASLARERYSAGVATQLDVIQSERDLLAAEVADIQARFDLAVARASLRLSAGLPLKDTP